LQKKILITATDIFAISSQKKISLKSISISTRKQLGVREFCDLMKVESQKIKHSTDSVLPIQFFKSHAVVSNTNLVENTFTSSGTVNNKQTLSNRYFYLYGKLPKGFSQFYGNIEDCSFGFTTILPGREGSSLIGRRFNSVVQS
jgi:hypothetical protein